MIIKKNTHAPFRLPRFFLKHKAINTKITFTESCKYDLKNIDQHDINKVHGIAFITFASLVFVLKSYLKALWKLSASEIKSLHHYNSIRLGWQNIPDTNKIILHHYVYQKGVRVTRQMKVEIDVLEQFNAQISPIFYLGRLVYYRQLVYSLKEAASDTFGFPEKCIMYKLHGYFGGNQKATHDMEIKVENV